MARNNSFELLSQALKEVNDQIKFAMKHRPRHLCRDAKRKWKTAQCELINLQLVLMDKLKRQGLE